MGWGIFAKPGSKYGPCKKDCHHRDCKSTKEDAAKICRICGKPIGFETKFYSDNKTPDGLVHALCLWEEIDQS